MRWFMSGLMACCALASGAAAEPVLRLNPQAPCVTERAGYYPNVDLLLSNPEAKERQIEEVRGLLRSRSGELLERRLLWQQAVGLLGTDATVPAKGAVTLFNPFSFSRDPVGRTLTFEVLFRGDPRPVSATVQPRSCQPVQPLRFPIAGRVMVYDGTDALSHHRRGTYDDDWSRAMGIGDNFQRFGLDLVVIDAAGRFFTGDGSRTDQWLGWGRPVRAPGVGRVVAVHDGQPDNVVIGTLDKWTERPSRANPLASYGNYVLIEHGPGEFSLMGHLRNGSVAVKAGDRVQGGQQVGAIGNSGASGGVHLHFERRTGPGLAAMQTLPAYFTGISRVGERAQSGALNVDSGDVLIAR